MAGITEAITAVTNLLTKALGFAVDPDGYEQLSRENKLKLIGRGMNDAIANNDWPTADLLFANYRELRLQQN